MRIWPAAWSLAALLLSGVALEAEEAASGVFAGHGIVIAVQPGTGALTIRHGDIKGFMDAMEMMYKVKRPDLSAGLRAGDEIDFEIDAAKYEILDVTVVRRGR